MCQEILTQADMKAIAVARKFDKESIQSRDKFEKYFNSVVGVQEAIASLTDHEKIFLFYMGTESRDVEFFSPLYQKEGQKSYSYGTYTQIYSEVYRLIQNNLIRKGILVVWELSYGMSKMERLRFSVPSLFTQYLKGVVLDTSKLEINGTVNDTIIRKKISECTRTTTAKDLSKKVHIKENMLYFGDHRFSVELLDSWRIHQWFEESSAHIKKNKKVALESKFKNHFIENLKKLSSDEWFRSLALQPILEFISCDSEPLDPEKICEIGFQYGFLKKTDSNGESLYAKLDLFNNNNAQNPSLESYLKQEKDKFMIELSNIPYSVLEQLARYGSFSVFQNKLMLSFDFASLVKMDADFLCSPLLSWMREKLPLLEHQVNQIQLKHGKILLHKNLILAKVNDLRVKAQLVKACQNMKDVLFLPNDFLAFPQSYRQELERIIKKNGYAIRKN